VDLRHVLAEEARGADQLDVAPGVLGGDYGKSVNVNKAGKPEKSGNYELVKLQRGTFLFNKTNFNEVDAKTSFPINKKTCSSGGTLTGTGTIVSGTGAYKGITGTLTITLAQSWVLAETATCSGSNTILDQNAYVWGTGTASY
jgi:hypothetical protein